MGGGSRGSCHLFHTHPALLPSSWTQHPLIQKNRRVVLASFLLLLLGLGKWPRGPPGYPASLHEGAFVQVLHPPGTPSLPESSGGSWLL